MKSFSILNLTLCALCGESTSAPPTVEAAARGVGQRGTTFTLKLTGARLTDPRELMFYAPGLTCTKLVAASENEVTATLTAAPGCRPGEHSFRLRTAGGASELRTVHVTPFPLVPEADGNDTPATAQPIRLGSTVTGTIESADADCYRVAVKKGQRLSAEVVGIRLGAGPLDAVLSVLGPDGRLLAEVDDTPLFRQDPFVSLVAPTDGEYVVRVRESAVGGGAGDRYALHVGSFARPAGAETRVRYLGGPRVNWRSFKSAAGPGPSLADRWNVGGFPTLYLIDHAGVIRKVWQELPDVEMLAQEVADLVAAAEKK